MPASCSAVAPMGFDERERIRDLEAENAWLRMLLWRTAAGSFALGIIVAGFVVAIVGLM